MLVFSIARLVVPIGLLRVLFVSLTPLAMVAAFAVTVAVAVAGAIVHVGLTWMYLRRRGEPVPERLASGYEYSPKLTAD